MTIIPIILSGGSGIRLWPLSTSECPKQFLPLLSDKTLFQQTFLRLKGLEVSSPIISCNVSHRFFITQQLSEISDVQPLILLEPAAKNTAPAIGAACLAAMQKNKDAIVIVLPSDHFIKDEKAFQLAIKTAIRQAKSGYLVAFGIPPSFPSIDYGYIKTIGPEEDGAYVLKKFVEKPSFDKAQEYLATGEYSWNSGIFVFKASVFLNELDLFESEMYLAVKESFEKASFESDFIHLDKASFESIKGNSIDYAVMEKTSKGKLVKLSAGWDDIGSWSAIWKVQAKDMLGNVVKGNPIIFDTTHSYIHAVNRTVVVAGLDNVVVVDSGDSLLVMAKNKVQDIRKIIEKIKKQE